MAILSSIALTMIDAPIYRKGWDSYGDRSVASIESVMESGSLRPLSTVPAFWHRSDDR